jgi:hypothetical protein
LQLRRICFVNLHVIHWKCIGAGRLPVVRRTMRLDHGSHILERRLHRPENRKFDLYTYSATKIYYVLSAAGIVDISMVN